MNSLWLSYVPSYVAQDIIDHPGEILVGRTRRFEVVALFADVSGFTALSEALGRMGRSGTEELTTILNGYFGPMIDVIEAHGGIIGKFGGDAMTILFPYVSQNQATIARRALQCALDMQAAMHRYRAIPTSAGVFSLTMKAGLAMGPVLCTTVGDPESRLEHIIGGRVLDLCAEAEHHASMGEVVVHDALLQYTREVVIAEERGGFSHISALEGREKIAPLPGLRTLPIGTDTILKHYLHPMIARRVAAGLSGFVNEHRKVTVLFVRFDGFDYDDDPDVSAKLQEYLGAVIRIIDRYDEYLNKVDMGDKGCKYIALFGAPVQHEDDEERALRCALDLRAQSIVGLRIGINTGFVFCGQVGAEARQEYTVMGDTVNIAARLMQAAQPGQILASEMTRRRAADAFDCETFAAITVKGKTEPVPICAVRGMRKQAGTRLLEPSYPLPMVGRAVQLASAQQSIDRVLEGRGQIIAITAEAGMGKSRLNAEIIRLASARGMTVYVGACQSYGSMASYLVWQDIWRGFFAIDTELPLDHQLSQLAAGLRAINSLLVQRMPLLGTVLNLAIPDTMLTQELDPQLRTELLRSLLLQCLQERSRSVPTVMVLEDCHWIDPLSLELLSFIARNLQDLPVLIIMVYRPPEGKHAELNRITRLAHATEMRLTEFMPEEAKQLIALKLQQRWGDYGVPGGFVERVTARAHGNPFYIEELINYIYDCGIDPQDTHALERLDLPESLQSLILSRIDQLGSEEQITLKVASVIGRAFRASWVWGSYPEAGTPDAVKSNLQALHRLDLTPLDKPEPELEYLFKHATTQEVAYDSLAFGHRATLHERIGQFVEQSYAGDIERQVDVLAYHYGRSRNTDKQRTYFRKAGDEAKATYANQAAIDYYQRLLPLLPASEQGDVMRELGEVWELTGKWAEAEETFRNGLAIAEKTGDRTTEAWLEAALGHLLSSTESYAEAVRWLERARIKLDEAGERRRVMQVLGYLGNVYGLQSEYEQAIACSTEQLTIATEQDDATGMSIANAQLGMVYAHQGEFARALTHFREALDAATDAGDRRTMIQASTDMAFVYSQQGDFARAITCLFQALEAAAEIGYLHMVGLMIQNVGEIYRLQGDFTRALTCYARALHIATELGDWPGVLYAVGNAAIVFSDQEAFRQAERFFVRAVELARMLNVPFFLCELLYRKAGLLGLQHQYQVAVTLNTEALQIATEVENRDIQLKANILSIRFDVALFLNDPQAAIDKLMDLLDEWSDQESQGSIYYEMWRIDNSREESRAQAASLYRQLYEQTPNFEYRKHYEELLGLLLPAPPPLRSLPQNIMGPPIKLEELLERAGVGQ